MITVLGATGHTGGRVAAQLRAAGAKVRAVGRSTERLAGVDAEPWVGDASDPAFLTEAFRGADAAYVLLPLDLTAPGYHAQQDGLGASIVAAIRASGLRRVVALSSLGADVPTGTGFLTSLYTQEQRLRAVEGLDVLFLRPGLFFESFLPGLDAIRAHNVHVDSIDPEITLPMVATRDVGDAAAAALIASDWSGVRVRELLGPRDLTLPDATRILGEGIGMPDLKYVRLPDAELIGLLTGAGLPADLAELHVGMNRAFNDRVVVSRSGRTPETTTPTSLAEFAAAQR
jgi:uncharacterized protein YbjT (DUF2867 family)